MALLRRVEGYMSPQKWVLRRNAQLPCFGAKFATDSDAMTKTLAAQTRLLIAFIVSAPTLLGVSWLVQNGSRKMGLALFSVLLLVDFLVLKPKPTTTGSPTTTARVPSRAIWVIGAACFLGSLSLLLSGIRAHETWEIVLGSFGMLASGWGASFARK